MNVQENKKRQTNKLLRYQPKHCKSINKSTSTEGQSESNMPLQISY